MTTLSKQRNRAVKRTFVPAKGKNPIASPKQYDMVQNKTNTLLSAYGAIKTAAAKAAGKLNRNKRELTMRFYKEDWTWYADVNGQASPKAMLLMVDGADTFLDYLSNNGDEVTLDLSLDPKQGCDVQITDTLTRETMVLTTRLK